MDGGSIVSGKKAGLQFSDPIPTLEFCQGRVACEIALELDLIELIIVKGSKFWSQAAKGPDKAELRFDMVDDETESNLLCKLEAILGFTLCLSQLISCCQHIFDKVVAAKARKGNITNFVGGIEGAVHQIAAGLDMSRPWQDDISEVHIGSSLVALQSAFFDQVITEPPEAKPVLVVAEARPGYDGK